MHRMNSETMLFCHMELKWNDKDPNPCRDEVQNNPESIRKHMIRSHGWKKIPELAQRECKNSEDEQTKYELYLTNPVEWFFDNQIIWSHFRNSHFRKTFEVENS